MTVLVAAFAALIIVTAPAILVVTTLYLPRPRKGNPEL